MRLLRWLCSREELQPCAVDRYGVSALHKAVSFGSVACVEALLEAGASRVVIGSLAVRDREAVGTMIRDFGAGAICIAAERGHVAVVELLLVHGAKARAVGKHGLQPLDALRTALA